VQQHVRHLATRLLKRDWRSGELRVLIVALLIAVASATSVAFFTDRIFQALLYKASELLAADLRVVSDHQLNTTYIEQARKLPLHTAQTVSFRSMSVAGAKYQLAEIKAVSDEYPLRGTLKISSKNFGSPADAHAGPRPGQVWLEPRLAQSLGISVGQKINLGSLTLTFSAVLQYEPDRSGDMFSIAPRLMMNLDDLGRTGLIQEGSRMQYRLLVAGDKDRVQQFRSWVEKQLQAGEKVEDVQNARQEVRLALERGQQFLGLSATVSVVLAFIAVAMAARRYAERHMNSCAILRCLGMRHGQIFLIFFWQLTVLGMMAGLLGCVLGYLAHQLLCDLASRLILIALPAPSFWPIVMGMSVGVVGLVGFALPPIYRLRHIPTMGVIRREFGSFKPATLVSYLPGVVTLMLLVIWQSGSWQLGWRILLGIIGTTLLLMLVAYAMIFILQRTWPGRRFEFRFALLNIVRHRATSIAQLVSFGIGIMVLLLLSLVRTDLLNEWQHSLPDNASNRFVINIQPDQLQKVHEFFTAHNFTRTTLYPMVRGRWTKLNDNPVQVEAFTDERAKRLATREFNLSWADTLQVDNKIVQGQWWDDKNAQVNQFSVEEGIAKTLHIQLGDTLTFEVVGETVQGKITSLRSVQWDTFRANFFVVAKPGLLDKFPASYITSFYLPKEQVGVLNDLVQQFPNLTVIDISAVMNQVRGIMSRITVTVQYVFLFTLLAGLTVMFAAIQSTLQQRIRENAILRAIGAGRRRLMLGMAVEFTLLGLLAGALAAFGASVAGWILAEQVFTLNYQFNYVVWLVGILGGAVGVGIAGMLGTRRVLSTPPLGIIQRF